MRVICPIKLQLPLARRFWIRKKLHLFLLSGLVLSSLFFSISVLSVLHIQASQGTVLGQQTSVQTNSTVEKVDIKPTSNPIPTAILTLTPTLKPTKTLAPTARPLPTSVEQASTPTSTPTAAPTAATDQSQYTAEKIGDTTWRVKNVANDSSMASAQDLFNALNSYRQSRGVGTLAFDQGLTDLANSRVNTFASNGGLDQHAGFKDFMNNDGFSKVGFNGLGENAAHLAGPMSGDRIVKEIFGADGAHDGNQLDGAWTHAGIGINGNFVNVNFGKGKR